MKMSLNKFVPLSLFVILLLSACNLGKAPPAATEAAVDEVVALPAETSTSVPPTEAVQHVLVPGELPDQQSGVAGDQDSSATADEKRAPSGDRFSFGRYERPFNSQTMDVYFPYLDIQSTEVSVDDTWIYGVITLKADESGQALSGKYGLEIDMNVDGGGEYLIMAASPSSTEWTTEGVQVWFDENDDVGGGVKVTSDSVPPGGDGYEKQVFGNDQGDDPDMAWVRISPADANTVQFAAKLSLLEGDTSLLVGMWAGTDDFAPELFDVNDTITHEQAGASLKELEFFYPIKEVSELDNACRMAVGFAPNGSEPGICPVPAGPSGGDDSPPGEGCPPPSVLYCSPNGCFCLEPQG